MPMKETAAPRQHAYTGQALAQLPEPSHAERTLTLISLVSIGTLSTFSRKHPGFPFGPLMPFAIDPAGQPTFLISNMATHVLCPQDGELKIRLQCEHRLHRLSLSGFG
jgi:heme iron utilization protein